MTARPVPPSYAATGVDGMCVIHMCRPLLSVESYARTELPGPHSSLGGGGDPSESTPSPSTPSRPGRRNSGRPRFVPPVPAPGPDDVSGVSSPYVTFHRSRPLELSTDRTTYSVRPMKMESESDCESSDCDWPAPFTKKPSSPCTTVPSVSKLRNSSPVCLSTANTVLRRVPMTTPPSLVIDGDASTSCLAVTGSLDTSPPVVSEDDDSPP